MTEEEKPEWAVKRCKMYGHLYEQDPDGKFRCYRCRSEKP